MASIEEFINKTVSNVNEGIKEKVEDGSFNRLGEGLSEGVSGIAEGMIDIIGKTKEAFGKLNEKANSIGKKQQVTPPPPTTEAVEDSPIAASHEESFIFCSQCGQKNPPDALFCAACGSPIQK